MRFFSVDWGTSSLRIRLVETRSGDIHIIKEACSASGILRVHTLWETRKGPASRLHFYVNFLREEISKMQAELSHKLDGIPIVLSGMAASTIGMKELPYGSVPFSLDGSNALYEVIPGLPDFPHDMLLVSGVATERDIMRGEEVQVIGLYGKAVPEADGIYIFPGTHSKHIRVKDHAVISFNTYMTGELFHLLTDYSILKQSIDKTGAPDEGQFFRKGVLLGSQGNLSNMLFQVRINKVLKDMDEKGNADFLSGLLIGYELTTLSHAGATLFLCSHTNLHAKYRAALQELSLTGQSVMVDPQEVDWSVVWGHLTFIKYFSK